MSLIDREFPTYDRGDVRETILTQWRAALRDLKVDEVTIRRATMSKSYNWVEAESLDLVVQGIQKRGDFLAQQVNPERSASPFLYKFHAVQSGLTPLQASGGSGFCTAEGSPGTTYIGSTTIPDPIATVGVDEAGNRYQVFITGTVPGAGTSVLLALVAIDTGTATNLDPGAEIKWSNKPIGSAPSATVTGDKFRGGGPKESDQEFITRLIDVRRSKPKAGNPSHMRYWARLSSSAVEDAFVYPGAYHSGSTMVAVMQKRVESLGPLGRMPTFATLAAVTGYLVPPTAPELPGDPHIVVVPWSPETCDVVLRLNMRLASDAGWKDQTPWPSYDGAAVVVNPFPSQSVFTIDTPIAPTTGIAPALMIWNDTTSTYESLEVASVVLTTPPNTYTVTLVVPHVGKSITAGDVICPDTGLRLSIAQSITGYFDSLGPGEVVDITSDVRAARAFRRIEPEIRYPYFVGSRMLDYLREGLGVSLLREELTSANPLEPAVVLSASLGPAMLVPGKVGVYAL